MRYFWILLVSLSVSIPAAAQEIRAEVRPYSVSADLHEVANLAEFRKAIKLHPDHVRMLHKNLFVCSPRGDKQLYWVYGRNDYLNLPSFVTSDSLLQLYHVFFDSTLRNIEENALWTALNRLTREMLAESIAQWKSITDPKLKQAALKNIAFFAVSSLALGRSITVPAEAERMAKAELAHIRHHAGYSVGAIFPYKIDYSQFITRGHYTKSQKLTRYFQAMMWYGLAPFATKSRSDSPGTGGGGAHFQRMDESIRQSLLLTRALFGARHNADWERIYEPTSLYAGTANDLTPAEWKREADRTFGPSAALAAYADASKYDSFIAALERARKSRIRSARRGTDLPDGPQLHFMGQRYIPDSEILQRLSGDERFPRGLDVMAVLGSGPARRILDANPEMYNPRHWAAYKSEREKLAREFESLPKATWTSNLYWSWLYALKALVEPAPAGYPSFMRNAAWREKSLHTSLASWTELRHDTILYGRQSAAEQGDGEEPPFVPGYVEPNVLFLDRLIELTNLSHQGLARRKLLSDSIRNQFAEFEDLLAFLRSVAVRELRNGKLTKKEHERIRHIEGDLEGMTTILLRAAGNYVALSEDDLDMALVADVHTGRDRALTEAVGHAGDIIAIVPIEGKLYLARGGVFSYYEFDVPMSERMTDQQWKRQLSEGKAPHVPQWIGSFFVPHKAPDRSE